MIPQALQVLAAKQRQLRKQSVDEGFELLAAKAATATTAEELAAINAEATHLAGLDKRGRQETLARVFSAAAEAAAINGDAQRLEMYLGRFGPDLPDTAAQLRRTVTLRLREQEAQAQETELELIHSMPTPEERMAAIEASGLDAGKKRSMIEHERQEILERTVNDIARLQGRDALAEIDRQEAVLGSARAQAMRESKIRESQASNADRIVIDVLRGQKLAAIGLTEAQERLDLFRSNPDHPDGITLDQFQRAARDILGTQEKLDKLTINKAIVGDVLAAPHGLTVPLTSDFDDAIKAAWADRGIAEIAAVPGEPGKFSFIGVSKPEIAAAHSAKMLRVLPDWETQIADGLNGALTPEQTTMATRAYAALHFQNPRLAAALRDRLSDHGKARADFAIKKLEQQRPEMLTVTGEPNPAWIERVREVSAESVNIEPVKLDNDQVRLRLFGSDRLVDAFPAIRESLGEAIVPGLDETRAPDVISGLLRVVTRNGMVSDYADEFRREYTRDVAITDEAVNVFHDYAIEEYRAQRSRGLPEAVAAEAAVMVARDRVFADFPPVLWNGQVIVGNRAPYPLTLELRTEMLQDIQTLIDEGKLIGTVGAYEREYTPTWNPTIKFEDGTVGGWVLLPNYGGDPLVVDGQVFNFTPAQPESMTVRELRDRLEHNARVMRGQIEPVMTFTKGDPLGDQATRGPHGLIQDPYDVIAESMKSPSHRRKP